MEDKDKFGVGLIKLPGSYHIGRVVLGLSILIATLYVYLTNYYSFEGKDALGKILAVSFIVDIVMFSNGLSGWHSIHNLRERVEKIKLKVEYEKQKQELNNLKKIN